MVLWLRTSQSADANAKAGAVDGKKKHRRMPSAWRILAGTVPALDLEERKALLDRDA